MIHRLKLRHSEVPFKEVVVQMVARPYPLHQGIA
jgi:hypothetical protein